MKLARSGRPFVVDGRHVKVAVAHDSPHNKHTDRQEASHAPLRSDAPAEAGQTELSPYARGASTRWRGGRLRHESAGVKHQPETFATVTFNSPPLSGTLTVTLATFSTAAGNSISNA